jgi:Raf kinase inhibitor-like YbhB/YbcL family protein
MRRWVSAALLTLLAVGCSGAPLPPEPEPSPQANRPTSAGPTPSLPLARAILSPAPGPAAQAGRDSQPAAPQPLRLVSPAFTSGGTLPDEYTCDGLGESPPLAWTGAPPGTAAFSLVEQDMDVKVGAEPFTHWLVYNMPRRVSMLDAGVPARPLLTNGSQQGQNSRQSIGYSSPCPTRGDPPHHLSFALFAQDGYVTLETGASVDAVRTALAGHVVAEAQLTVTFQR